MRAVARQAVARRAVARRAVARRAVARLTVVRLVLAATASPFACSLAGCFSYDSSGFDRDGGAPDGAGNIDAAPLDAPTDANVDATPAPGWLLGFGGSMDQRATVVASGRSGAVYFGGTFEDTVTFAGDTLPSAGMTDVWVARLGATDGAKVWTRHLGSSQNDSIAAIVADSVGDVIIVGAFANGFAVGDGIPELSSAGGLDAYIIKLSGVDGATIWVRQLGGTGVDRATDVAVDGTGIYVTGSFSGSVDLGAGVVTSAGGLDLFLMKLSADNSQYWASRKGGAKDDEPLGLALDAMHDLVVAGRFSGNASFGGATLTGASLNTTDVLLAKYAGVDGAHIWSQRFGTGGNDAALDVAIDVANGPVITGYFEGDVDLGSGTPLLNADPATADLFVARYDALGGHLWSRSAGGPGDDRGAGLAIDAADVVMTTGRFIGNADFGGGALTADANGDAFLAQYSLATGAYVAAERFGGSGSGADEGGAVDTGAGGRVFVAGAFHDTAEFAHGRMLTSAGGADGFLLGLAP